MIAEQQSHADAILRKLGAAIAADARYADRDWASIAIVAIIEPGVRQVSGYRFEAMGEAEPGTPRNREIDALFSELQEATQVDGKGPWKSAVFKLQRAGMRYSVDFEYDNPTRWKVTPGDMDQKIAALRAG